MKFSWFLAGSYSVTAFVSQTYSLQWMDASTNSSLKSLEIIFAYLTQVFVLNQEANFLGIIGSVLTIIAIVGIKQAEKVTLCLCSNLQGPPYLLARYKTAILSKCADDLKKKNFLKTRVWE